MYIRVISEFNIGLIKSIHHPVEQFLVQFWRQKLKETHGHYKVLSGNNFQINTLRLSEEVEMLRSGKQSYLETSREDIREGHSIVVYCFTDSLFSRIYSSVDLWCLNTM